MKEYRNGEYLHQMDTGKKLNVLSTSECQSLSQIFLHCRNSNRRTEKVLWLQLETR